MMFAQPNLLPKEDADAVENIDIRRRVKYLRRCKDVLWSRWTGEYIKSLRERHNLNHKRGGPSIKEGDVALIQSDERNRGKWNLGIVVKLIKGSDGVVRGARLRARRLFLERAIQQLCLMSYVQISGTTSPTPESRGQSVYAQTSGSHCCTV